MTIHEDIAEYIGSIAVGASAEFPVESFFEEVTRETFGEQTALPSMLKRTWRIKAWAVAASRAERAALQNTIADTIALRGQSVTVTVFGVDREMDLADAMLGYPRVRAAMLPEDSVGPIQFFEVTAETVEPIDNDAGSEGLAEHAQTTETRVNQGGRETRTIRGSVMLIPTAPGTAKEWVIANVLPDAVADAATLNLGVEQRFTVGDDGKRCEYEITLDEKTPASNGGGGITFAEVTDASEVNDEGRIQRTVAGYAVGSSATTFAASQAPAGAGEVVVRQNVSQPRDPDGRVNFSYTALKGVDSLDFPGAPLLSVRETFTRVSSGSPVNEARFVNSSPILYSAGSVAFRYRQSTEIESLGSLAGEPSLLASADFLASDPVVTEQRQGEVVRTSLTAEFVSTAPIVPLPLRNL
jgi:hypothetical protein